MSKPVERVHAEPGRVPGSLRAELLFNLAFLAAAALLLALWTASIVRLEVFAFPQSLTLLVVLVVLDVLVFVALGNHLIRRLVLRPLAETAEAAEAIAEGDYERRVPPGRTREVALLARSLNRLTDQLLQNQMRLAENVRSLDETNQRLTEAQRDLIQAEKMASIGRLAAGIAHEIGNPLGALVGYASVLRRRGAAPELSEGIEREARRIDQIVRGLLDYARPGAGTREHVDVNDSVRRVVELLRQQGRLGGVEVQLKLGDALPPIDAVPHRLDQVFVNLFTNADAAMRGTGTLTIVTLRERYNPARPAPARRADDPPGVNYAHLRRQRHAAAREPAALPADREVVRVIVSDTGPGIAPEHVDTVFDPFFTTRAPGEGTGLGLAIVAGTVAEMGGRIEVSSATGGGAVFTLLLPSADGS
ncbi:MAG TPA: ATP-binding protein [Longimicrobiaceae bacterium]|nr:ATP-binding protein [Longimicrobiaceae bacterium]